MSVLKGTYLEILEILGDSNEVHLSIFQQYILENPMKFQMKFKPTEV